MNQNLYKKSRYLFYYDINKKIGAFYNSLNMGVVFGMNEFLKKINRTKNNLIEINPASLSSAEKKAIEKLKNEGFLIEEKNREGKIFNEIKQKSVAPTELIALYLILTENCNFRCRYCAFFAHLPKNYKSQLMTKATADRALDLFLKYCSKNRNKKKSIVLYGGEPLLNIPTFKHVVERVRSRDFERKCNDNLEIVTFTNGSLITPDIAKFCSKNKIIPIVSIDGPKEIHDLMRKDINKKDTFEKVLNGYCLLKKYGCDVGISTTIASHNVESLSSIVKYFKDNLRPVNIGLNPLHLTTNPKEEPWAISLEKSAYGMTEAFKTARKLGIYVEQVMRRIRPFVERTPRVKDCPSCGGLIRFYPSGKYGPCGHFVSMGKNCLSINGKTSWEQSNLRKRWRQRSSFNMGGECKFCSAISICGGGCPLSAYKRYNDIMGIDDRVCIQSKIFLEWLIKDLYEIIKPNFKKDALIYTPTEKERSQIYGKINPFNKKLPLQEYSRFGEIYE